MSTPSRLIVPIRCETRSVNARRPTRADMNFGQNELGLFRERFDPVHPVVAFLALMMFRK
jgi:hypothetical protein